MSLFSGHSLTCQRGGRIVFEDLSFDLKEGGALTVTGANGSGKSSLLRVMAGLLRPVAGALSWQGAAVRDNPEAHRGGLRYVGHHDAVKPVLTVAENLAFWAQLYGGGAQASARDIDDCLESFALGALRHGAARFLSAGQRRRLALARLLVAPARLWLLDEPSVGLDRDSLGRLTRAVADHRAGGGAVVVATHTEISMPGAGALSLDDHAPGALPELVW